MDKVTRDGYYPLADYLPGRERHVQYMAKWTGEKRPPREGEWFLSGCPVDAYRARVDLFTPYHIAQVVQVERTVTYHEVSFQAPGERSES